MEEKDETSKALLASTGPPEESIKAPPPSGSSGNDTPQSEPTDTSDSSHEVTEAPPTPPPDPKPKDGKKSKKGSGKKKVISKEGADGESGGRDSEVKVKKNVAKNGKRKADALVNGDVGDAPEQHSLKEADANDVNNDSGKPKAKKPKKQPSQNNTNGKSAETKTKKKSAKKAVPLPKTENGEVNDVGDSAAQLESQAAKTELEVHNNAPVVMEISSCEKETLQENSMVVDSQPDQPVSESSAIVTQNKDTLDALNVRELTAESSSVPLPAGDESSAPVCNDIASSPVRDDDDDDDISSDSSMSSDDEMMEGKGSEGDSSAFANSAPLVSDSNSVIGTETGLIGVPKVGRPEDLLKAQNKEEDDDSSGERPYSCPQCSYKGRKKGQLRKHLAVHNMFPCAHCDMTSESRELLQEHMKVNHPSRTGRKLCKKCCVLFLADELDEHEANCTGEKQLWTCKECGKTFKFVCALKSHVHRWHTEEGLEASKRFQCDQCDFRGVFMRDLKQHQSAVHRPPDAERTVKCTECTSTFYNKDELKRHIRECHTEDRPHVCHMCDKAFKTKTHLKNHYNTHNPSDTFKCEIEGCTSTFKAEKYMERHRVDIHKLPPRRKRTPHPCQFDGCTEVFNKKSHLKRHELTHTGEREFPCEWPECTKVFRHADNLKVHMQRHQGLKTIKCELCDNAYYQKSGLRYHMRKTHGIRIVSAKTKQKEEQEAAAAAENKDAAASPEPSSSPAKDAEDKVGEVVKAEVAPSADAANKDVYDFNDSDDDKINIQIRQMTPVRSPRISDEASGLKADEADDSQAKDGSPAKLPPQKAAQPKKGKKATSDKERSESAPKKKKSKSKAKVKAAEEIIPDEDMPVDAPEEVEEADLVPVSKGKKKGTKKKTAAKPAADKKAIAAEKKAKAAAEKKEKAAAERKEKAAERKAKAKKAPAKKGKGKSKKKGKKVIESEEEVDEAESSKEEEKETVVAAIVDESVPDLCQPEPMHEEGEGQSPIDDVKDRSPPVVDLMVEPEEAAENLPSPGSDLSDQEGVMVVDAFGDDNEESLPVLANETEQMDVERPPSPTPAAAEIPLSPLEQEEAVEAEEVHNVSASPSDNQQEDEGESSDDNSQMPEEFTHDMYEMPRAPAPPPAVSSDEEEEVEEVMVPPTDDMNISGGSNEVPVIVSQNQSSFEQPYEVSDSTTQDATPPSVAQPLSVAPPNEIPQTPTERSSLDYPMQTPLSEPYSVPPPSYGERRSSYGAEITSPLSVKPHERTDLPSNESGAAPNYGYPDSSASYPGSYPPQQQQQQQQHGIPMPGSVEPPPQQDMHVNSVPPPTGGSYSSNEQDSAYHPPSVSQHQSEPYTPGATTVSYSFAPAPDPLVSSKSQEGYGESLPRIPEGPTYLPSRSTTGGSSVTTSAPSSAISGFGTDSFPSSRDFFGQYFQDPSTLPLTHPPLSAQDQSRLPPYQQQPLSALQHPNADFLRRASLMPGATYPSVTESLMSMTPGLPQPAQQHWMAHDERSRHWGQPSPILMPSDIDKTSPLARNPYSSEYGFDASNPSSQISKRPPDTSFPPQTTSASTDRYDLTSAYMSSRTFNPAATGGNYPRSVGAAPSSQKHFEEAYRQAASHISDYRSIAQPPPPPMHDMYSRMGMSMGLDKYYYPREAMYRSQHTLSSAPNPFMPPSSSAQMPVYSERDYARNAAAAAMYPQHSAYSFMSDKQYLSAAVGNKVPQPPGPPGMPGAEYLQPPTAAPTDMQDPYRRSVIYNMMPRYF